MEQKEIKIKAGDAELKGAYSNLVQIGHTREEFCLDFLNIFPPQGMLVSRIILSPGHVKRLVNALQENMAKYEGQFGRVEPAEKPETSLGFQP